MSFEMKKLLSSLVISLSIIISLAGCQSVQVKKDAVHIDAILDGLQDSVAIMTLEYGS